MRDLWRISTIGLAFGLAFGASVSAGAAEAQPGTESSADSSGGDIDDIGAIIVTARRTEERLQDVPISITVFNQEQLAQRNITSPVELATYTPSLTANQRFGSEKSSFVIRGFTQEGGTSPSVGSYFADVVSPRAQGVTGGGNGALPGSLFDLQNVQVLKGPQGTLFGRNTTGGAVLLVPQKPTDRLEGYVEGSAGNYDMWRGQAVLNVPLADTFRVRLGVDRMKRDGYLHNHSGVGPDDYADTNYFAARLSIVGELTPNLENYIVASYNHSFGHGFSPRIVLCNPSASSGRAVILARPACDQIARHDARGDNLLDVDNSNPDPFIELEQWQVINTTTWKASDTLTVKNIASYGEHRERASFSLGGDNFTSNFPAGFPLPSGRQFQYILLSPTPNEDSASQSTFTEELQFQGSAFEDRLTWQAGAYLEVSKPIGFNAGYNPFLMNCTDVQALQCTNPLFIGVTTFHSSKSWFNNKALYAQGSYRLTDQLTLTGGIRYTMDKTRAISQNTTLSLSSPGVVGTQTCTDSLRFKNAAGTGPRVVSNRGECNYEFRENSKRPTWLIGLDFKPTEDMMLYAKWARGYRQGGIITNNIGVETWGPEKVDTYEVGAKTSFRGAVSGYFNLAGFYNDFRDQQINSILIAKPTSGIAGSSAILNAGKSRIWGIEADASVNLIENLRLDLGYAYLNTKLIDITLPTLAADSPFATILTTAEEGKPLAFSPKNRVTATGTYTLPLDESIGKISVSATYVHTDAQNATSALASPLYRLPATDLLNLNLDWNSVMGQPIDLALFATNVTNEIYPVGVGSQYSSAGFENVIVAPPRMYGVRLRYRFGN